MTRREHDPDQPGFQATYDPSDRRRVGHGADFGADLYYLYRAGRTSFPETATTYSGWTSTVHDLSQRTGFLYDSVDGQHAMLHVEQIRDELAMALRETTLVLDGVGSALVRIASDFAETDQEACARFNSLVRHHPGLLAEPTVEVPRPPGVNDPFVSSYVGPSLDAPERSFALADGFEDAVVAAVVAAGAGLGAVIGAVRKGVEKREKEAQR